jgi:hypothetical protein
MIRACVAGLVPLLSFGCGPSDSSTDATSGAQSSDGSGSGDSATTLSATGTTAVATSDSSSDGAADSSTGPDLPPIDCETIVESDLPGVSIELTADCAYSLAQAQAGVEAQYVVTIADPLEGVDSSTSCYDTPRGGLHVEWSVFGGGLEHCYCDVGLCPAPEPMPTTLVPGSTPGSLTWNAYDWDGPSDFGAPFGRPFPAGTYAIEVVATGTWADPVAGQTPFVVRASRPVVLVE